MTQQTAPYTNENRFAQITTRLLRSEPISPAADKTFTVVRIIAGLVLSINFGILYKFPVPEWFVSDLREHMPYLIFPVFFAWAASLSEVVGGLLLALGLFTRVASFFIICTMLGAAAFKMTVTGNYWQAMPSMVFLMVAIYHLMLGGGRHSLDARLLRRLDEE